jgi:DNA-binding MarR family transcriptional regulator
MSDADELHAAFVGVVRALGLLRPDTTPCGQPISIVAAHALGELDVDGALTQNDLAARLRLQKSTISRLVDQLVDDGLVRRVQNPADRRSVLVELTAKGATRVARLHRARAEMFAELLRAIPPRDRRTVVQGLSLLETAARARS